MEKQTSLLDSEVINKVLNSDASLDVLLVRLKQSINTGEELAKYIKKKVQIEDEHYGSLKKFAAQTRSTLKAQQSKLKQDSFSNKMDTIIGYDELLYGPGSSYVKALNTMFDELNALIATISRSRKQIKDEGKRREKECSDAIVAAEKAKQKYYHLCDDLEKVRQRDPNQKSFLKGRGGNQEDDIQRKIDMADQDYNQKVLNCKKLKDELLIVHRPTISKKLKNLILEFDIAMNVQLQKYATWNENLIMNSGILISPLKQASNSKLSMKEVASSVDNEKDLYTYLAKYEKQPENKSLATVDYIPHPSMKPLTSQKPFLQKPPQQNSSQSYQSSPPIPPPHTQPVNVANDTQQFNSSSLSNSVPYPSSNKAYGESYSESMAHSKDTPLPSIPTNIEAPYGQAPITEDHLEYNDDISGGANGPVQFPSLDPKPPTPKIKQKAFQPTFGISIEDLIKFAGIDNVPLVVKKCIEKIELYGLDMEGLYRASANVSLVQNLREEIDQNYTNYLIIGAHITPNNVTTADIFTIASLLKLYFSQLPEPLLTSEYYQSFIDTVKSSDEGYIAKKLHHLVFNLPDGAYFTLRAIIFHLKKVAEHEEHNRMSAKNLAIIWGPVLLNENSTSAQDLPYKSKVVEELMIIANEIFEAD